MLNDDRLRRDWEDELYRGMTQMLIHGSASRKENGNSIKAIISSSHLHMKDGALYYLRIYTRQGNRWQ